MVPSMSELRIRHEDKLRDKPEYYLTHSTYERRKMELEKERAVLAKKLHASTL